MVDNVFSNTGRILTAFAIFLQLFSMYSNKNTKVNYIAFFLYGIGVMISSYKCYVKYDRTFHARLFIKSFSGLMFLLIASYAYVHQKK